MMNTVLEDALQGIGDGARLGQLASDPYFTSYFPPVKFPFEFGIE